MALTGDGRSISMSSENLVHDSWGSSRPFKRRRIQQNATPPLSPCPSPGCASWCSIEDDLGLQEVQEYGYPAGMQPSYERRRTSPTQLELPRPEQEIEKEVCFGMVSTKVQILALRYRLTVGRSLASPFR